MSGLLASAGPFAYLGLFGIAAGESSALLGLALPGEAFVLVAGALAARGSLNLFWLLPSVIAGAILGDSIGYALGRHFGGCRDHGWLGKVWSCGRMARVRLFFDRRGGATVFLARFIGFLRPLAPFAAGAVRMPYRPFLAYNVAGAVVWGTGTVLAGYFLGTPVEHLLRSAGVWLAIAAGAVGLFAVIHRRRRERAAVLRDGEAQAGHGSHRARPGAGRALSRRIPKGEARRAEDLEPGLLPEGSRQEWPPLPSDLRGALRVPPRHTYEPRFTQEQNCGGGGIRTGHRSRTSRRVHGVATSSAAVGPVVRIKTPHRRSE